MMTLYEFFKEEAEIMGKYANEELVEVVRCKDCEHWQTDWKPKGCEHEDAHFCEMIGRIVCADHYCGYGERREDGN